MQWSLDSRKIAIPVLIALLVAAIAAAVYFYEKASSTIDPSLASKQEVAATIIAVGKLIDLPRGEAPTVATVSNADELKSQQFFANVKQGDKVLIYTTAKMAYLYDPAANRLINVAPLNIGIASSTPAPKK